MMTEAEAKTYEQWHAEGVELFGPDEMQWRFVCPVCRHVATPDDWKAAGAPSTAVAFSCIGRWLPNAGEAFDRLQKAPCNYAGGGLFKLNPVTVNGPGEQVHHVFAFDRAGRPE